MILKQPDLNADEMIFNAMIDEHLPMWRQVAFQILNNAADADDAVQQALVGAWSKRDTFRSRVRLSNRVYRIVANRSYDLLRRKAREADRRARLADEAAIETRDGGGRHAAAATILPRKKGAVV